MRQTATKCAASLLVLALAGCGGSSETDSSPSGGDFPVANTNCDSAGDIEFICNVPAPEDIVAIPETPFVVVSGYAGGGIHFVSTRDRTRVQVYPVDELPLELDTQNYAACPGPPDPAAEGFSAHGLNIRTLDDGRHLLYVVHHGSRESIELFEVDTRRQGTPGFTWVGCVVAPEGVTSMNSVSPLPEGGFVATVLSMPAELIPADRAGESYGVVMEWTPMSGWAIVPGSESSGPNGLEASHDGRWIYVNLWSGGQLMRLSRGQAPAVKEVYDLSFRPDNIRWQADGSLLTAGHRAATSEGILKCLANFCEDASSHVVRIDPGTMAIEEIASFPASEVFFTGTSALQVGDEIWIGSFRGERIARYKTH